MSLTDNTEEEDLLEGQRIFNGPQKLGKILFGSSTSVDEEADEE